MGPLLSMVCSLLMGILAVALPRNPNHPHARGTAQCDDIYFQAVEVCVCVCLLFARVLLAGGGVQYSFPVTVSRWRL